MNDDYMFENQLLSGVKGLGQNQFNNNYNANNNKNNNKSGFKHDMNTFKKGISLKQTRLHRESNTSPKRGNGFNMFEMVDDGDDDIEVVYESKKDKGSKKDKNIKFNKGTNELLKDLNNCKAKFSKSTNEDYQTKNTHKDGNVDFNTEIMCNEFVFKA